MKLTSFLQATLLAGTLALGACGKDDAPSGGNNTTNVVPKEALTTYTGDYALTTGSGIPTALTGVMATVADNGSNTIKITFSAPNAPTLTATMKKNADGTFANSDDTSGLQAISIHERTLDVSYTASPTSVMAYSGTR
ncbi:hypothetical protein [Hymenobacter rubripertinctus]|uniref:Lipocalin-like domain-containing protein n=1 Tax=Hymenobacter rubripertinctus TaxID=2029981 RepID=A0A418R0U9_9BACT|nr:hypothetical protein [Hymenobacter rubripertinctus]RIY10998.1 hypothetical protein D0T11_08280 [Hymenobacter rubripertinctus]